MRTLLPSALLLLCSLPVFAQNANSWANAKWVWDEANANSTPQNDEPRYLRRTFTLATKPTAAELWITADNIYTVYVNGQKIGTDSEWNTVERYNVAKHLVAGKNVLAIQAINMGGPAGVIARLHVKTADKKGLFVVTDETTRVTQKASADWLKTDFDDSSWFAAVVLGDASIGPWNLTGGPANVAQGPTGKGKNYGSNAADPKLPRQTPQAQAKNFIVPKDFEIELVAADPLVINPITMVLDDKGRIIVSESHTYRYGPPGSPIKPYANPVVRLDPDGKGGFTRTLIADGFTDPVMGIAIKGNKLWLTACDYLYTYDIPEGPAPMGKDGKAGPLATNKKLLLKDHSKAWNPFGMFVLEWGPDGKLYMSVGNHNINIEGPDGKKISARGGSGMIMRMNPDGTNMERLVHGLRVPYSFDMDPFGQLWLLSNGEGNPDRFVRVIEGVDYHCYSRGQVDNNWLAGNHPLAPPCEEVHGGAHTQFMRYYSSAYPKEYWGNLFACNWGRHGFAGANRGIFRFVLDERNNIVTKETLVTCTDPHFRPSHIHLDTDGSLLIADWYGRDDESDMTGRIWRLKYVGKDRPEVKHKLDSEEWKKNADYKDVNWVLDALGSPNHMIREKAMKEVERRCNLSPGDETRMAQFLKEKASSTMDPMVAVFTLWAMWRIDSLRGGFKFPFVDVEHGLLLAGKNHPDWRVRRLSVNLARRAGLRDMPPGGLPSLDKADPAVKVELALHGKSQTEIAIGLTKTLESETSKDAHLRYEAAWHLAKHGDEKSLATLLSSENADVRLAGLIAIDIACWENFPSKKAALAALANALENPGKLNHQLLLTVAQLDGDASIVPALSKLIARDDLPAATVAKAVLVLKAKAGGNLASAKLTAQAGKRLIEAVEKGSLKIASPADQLVIFEFLESEGPTPFALKQVGGQLQSNNKDLRLAAHTLARRFGSKADLLSASLWPRVLNPKAKFDDAIESLSTIARIEAKPSVKTWSSLLAHDDPLVRMETVRWWRRFENQPEFIGVLNERAVDLQKKDPRIGDDLVTVSHFLSKKELDKPVSKTDLATYATKEIATMTAAERPMRAAMGHQVFERNACTKCHTTATATTLLAPSLKGVGGQKVDYLVESVLYPSKIIKTGWEVETVELKNGKTLIGLVKDEGKFLRVLNLDKDERVAKGDIESRATSKISVMPEGQESTLSRREFVDLIAYLQTLK